MNFSQLQAFVAVVKTGSFTAAAEQANLTQSAISHALNNLEAELGVTLFTRGRQGISLTEAGQALLPNISEILAQSEAIRQKAAALRGIAAGKLRIGSFPSISPHLLAGLLQNFQHRYPGIEVVVLEGLEPEVNTWVGTGLVDLGFATLPVANLESVVLVRDELLILTTPDCSLARRTEIAATDLVNEPFILSKAGCDPLILSVFQIANVKPRVQYEVSDVGTILRMVREGLGTTMLPRLNLPEDQSDLHVMKLLPPAYRELGLIFRSASSLSPAAKAFIEQARQWGR
jgi:DNA-binding transcriptional LysR family regulator